MKKYRVHSINSHEQNVKKHFGKCINCSKAQSKQSNVIQEI